MTKVGERQPQARGSGAHVAQLVERVLGKDEVISSILIMGSIRQVKPSNAWKRESEVY